jgi:hypothetical protein
MKEKNMLDLKLSEFVDKCLQGGVIPFLKFLDKDKVESGTVERFSLMEQTPLNVLQREIRVYERCIKRLELGEDILDFDKLETKERITAIISQTNAKIEEFKGACSLLNSEQEHQRSVANTPNSSNDADNHNSQPTPKEEEVEKMAEAVDIIKSLCNLKKYKDTVGKDSYYQKEQPKAWDRANYFLNNLAGYNASKTNKS